MDNINPFFGKRSIKAAFELTDALNVPQFFGGDTGVSYRTINHWESEGLIENRREDDQKWRRFSFVDFVWIKMLDQMRALGLGIDVLRSVKELVIEPTPVIDLWTLMAGLGEFTKMTFGEASEQEQKGFEQFFEKLFLEEEEEQTKVTLLQLLIANAITKRCPIRLIVFLKGDFTWIEEHPEFVINPEFTERFSYEPFVSISITGILREFMGSELGFERMESLKLWGPNEIFLLKTIFSGEYDSIKINYRDSELDTMEMVKSQEVTKKVVDVLAEADYQNITIVQHQGLVTRIENTVKHRFERKEEKNQ